MNLIYKVTDDDIGGKYIDISNPKTRLGARGIVIREDGKIAVFNKSNKNEYKLVGGGIDEGEDPVEAFKREVLEETGCIIKDVIKIGIIEECLSKNNFMQTSYVFIAQVKEDTKKLNITQKEKDEGAKLIWETPFKALELIKNCFDNLIASNYDSIYVSKSMVFRDRKILEYYINNFVNK